MRRWLLENTWNAPGDWVRRDFHGWREPVRNERVAMAVVVFALVTLVVLIAVGLKLSSGPSVETLDIKRPLSTEGMAYPNGSVPYGDGQESALLRARRFACAAVNHHPRHYDGSWCSGYGYVCSRCAMYADPFSPDKQKSIIDDLNAHGADQMDMAAVFNGGPHVRRAQRPTPLGALPRARGLHTP